MPLATPAAPALAQQSGVVLPLPAATDDDGRPTLRLLPAPPCEPPYDDELPAPALRALSPGRTGSNAPAAAPAPVLLRLVPARAVASAGSEDDLDDGRARRTPLAELPPARPFAQALVQRVIEVLAGLRPVSQLQRDTTFELFDQLEQVLPVRSCTSGPRPSRRDVRSLHVQASEDGVAEVCATVHRGGRFTALALRLEGVDGSWRCTALQGV